MKIMQVQENWKWWISAGLLSMGAIMSAYVIKDTLLAVKAMERTVIVKGLAEQEVAADTVIWPIVYRDADNNLSALVTRLEKKNQALRAFLTLHGFSAEEVTLVAPSVTDKLAQEYVGQDSGLRYVAKTGFTVYSQSPDKVKHALSELAELAKQDIAITDNYDNRIEYVFTGLNQIKPDMVQQATEEARAVALKFATDSESQLGKIKQANQGQFTIRDRDSNTPEIKVVRVVTSVEYYLSD